MQESEEELKKKESEFSDWSEQFAYLLVFGLILEIFLPFCKQIPEFLSRLIPSVIVALGVTGEIIFASKARLMALALQRISDDKLAAALDRQAKAEEKLAQVIKAAQLRSIDQNEFAKELHGKPKADIEILYKPHDEEVWMLAQSFHHVFSMMLGCNAIIRPIEEKDSLDIFKRSIIKDPLETRVGLPFGGLTLRVSKLPPIKEIEGAYKAISAALLKFHLVVASPVENSNIPPNIIQIVIGKKIFAMYQ